VRALARKERKLHNKTDKNRRRRRWRRAKSFEPNWFFVLFFIVRPV